MTVTRYLLLLCLTFPILVYGQELDSLFFSRYYATLERGIRETSRYHAMYAYDIANLGTPGFRPVLPKQDQLQLNQLLISGRVSNEVLLEFLMAKMAENSKRYTAYVTIWKGKVDSLRRIVTLGK